MPLRPFPLQIAVGTDIVHVSRIRAILQRNQSKPGHLERFLRRLFTTRERKAFGETQSLAEGSLDVASKHLAGRWAAKEATIKAVSWRKLGFQDVEIHRSLSSHGVFAVILESKTQHASSINRPWNGARVGDRLEELLPESDTATLQAEASRDYTIDGIPKDSATIQGDYDMPSELHGQIARVSISHDGDYATAVCLAAEEAMPGDVGGEAAARGLV